MTETQSDRVRDMLAMVSLPVWSGRVSEWCAQNIRFNEPKLSGPFTFSGREYLRQPLDYWADESATDMVMCFGTRTGKTRVIFGGLGWKIQHSPTRAIWVMPNAHGTGGAQNVSRTRFQPMIRATECLAEHIPHGNRRNEFKTLQMCLNGSIIDLTGAHSPANLAGNPCDTVVQDEVDKFKRLGESEADPTQLADQRCKEFSTPKRVKASTPTLMSGKIWSELMKSDVRRRFVPCPHCSKHVVFAWSEQYSILPKTGCEAYVSWSAEAKQGDGWDLDEVVRTAHAVCPHCAGHIRDEHKIEMDAKGEWRPTQTQIPGYIGWHLSSLYSVSKETTFGALAKKFLSSKRSRQSLQDFINSDLAEPYVAQEVSRKRTELIKKASEIVGEGIVKIMSVDCQARAPYFWFVVRAWKDGHSELVDCGPLDTWEDVKAKQLQHEVLPPHVIVDSGYGARTNAEVYRRCADYGEIYIPTEDEDHQQRPRMLGWIPAKGFPGDKRWRDPETSSWVQYYIRQIDPYEGTASAGRVEGILMEFSSDTHRDILEDLRTGRSGHAWTVLESAANETYWKHMDSHYKQDGEWKKRSERWPDHMNDCEIMQVVAARFYRVFSTEEPK